MGAIVDTSLPNAVSWHEDRDAMQRACAALSAPGGVWLLDPFEDAAALEAVEALGPVAGIVQLLDRHPRDGAALAERYGVPHLVLPDGGTPFVIEKVVDQPGWRERSLWWPEGGILYVPEAIGTGPYFALGRRAGIHPMLRLLPPGKALRRHPEAEHLLPGHGPALHGDVAAAIEAAVAHSRLDLPKLPLALLRAVRG
jgi:hypothetical protein